VKSITLLGIGSTTLTVRSPFATAFKIFLPDQVHHPSGFKTDLTIAKPTMTSNAINTIVRDTTITYNLSILASSVSDICFISFDS